MPTATPATDRRAQLVTIAETYFRGLANKDVSQVPWHTNVVFRSPLAPTVPEPLQGDEAVRAWFAQLYPVLGRVEVIEHYVDAAEGAIATRANVHITQPPAVLRVIDRFIVDAAGTIVEQENHYDPRPALQPGPGLITSQERELLVDLLVSSQQALLGAVVRLTPAQWTFTPGDGQWSIAECAQHLLLSEEGLLGMVHDQILRSAAAADKAASARGRDGIVVGAMRNRSNRVKTFDFLEPRSCEVTPAIFIEAFLKKRAATLHYVRETTDALHHHFAPLGPLGDLDGYQWLLLLASHTERHVAQIEEVKAQVRYPE